MSVTGSQAVAVASSPGDATRLRYLEVLSQRMEGAAPAVRQVLEGRLAKARAAHLAQTAVQTPTDASPESTDVSRQPVSRASATSTLAELTRYLENSTRNGDGEAASPPSATPPELRSVRGFWEVWSKIAAEHQLEQAFERGPVNAGPLNSHMLMLRSLGLMRELSPDYLRRFLAQVDSLLWLEQAGSRPKAGAGKGRASTGRQKS